jgi:hypothetical protein
MTKILFSAAVLLYFCFSGTFVFAQADSTRYINGLPVTEDDTARTVQSDIEPKNRLTAVSVEQLPQKLRDVLDREALYRGWQDSTIYFQNNTGLYLVPIKYEEGVKLFGLTEKGQPVTFNEIIIR